MIKTEAQLNEKITACSKCLDDKLTGKDTLVTFTVSADNAELPESVTKYL